MGSYINFVRKSTILVGSQWVRKSSVKADSRLAKTNEDKSLKSRPKFNALFEQDAELHWLREIWEAVRADINAERLIRIEWQYWEWKTSAADVVPINADISLHFPGSVSPDRIFLQRSIKISPLRSADKKRAEIKLNSVAFLCIVVSLCDITIPPTMEINLLAKHLFTAHQIAKRCIPRAEFSSNKTFYVRASVCERTEAATSACYKSSNLGTGHYLQFWFQHRLSLF